MLQFAPVHPDDAAFRVAACVTCRGAHVSGSEARIQPFDSERCSVVLLSFSKKSHG